MEALRKFSKEIAIQKSDLLIRYNELERKINALTNYLYSLNIPEKTYIAVWSEDIIDYIIVIIAIMNIRCVFVPIDEKLPEERIKMILECCDIKYIICDTSIYVGKFFKENIIIYNWKKQNKMQEYDVKMEDKLYKENDEIYIYFTSGSTGIPKGVIGKNESLVHFLNWEISKYSLQKGYKYAQMTSPSFDPFLRDIFVPLLSGGVICLLGDDRIKQLFFLPILLNKYKISVIHCVPSIFHILISSLEIKNMNLESIKYIFLAGEEPNIKDLKRWFKINVNSNIEIINFYGPTETTLVKMYHKIVEEDIINEIIPIGKPISDTKVYILDNLGRESEMGEICIETKYCSLGYVNNVDNLEKFLISSYNKNKYIYKTGDVGKRLKNGDVIFCGRQDRQIKISGISVNLQNIEKIILSDNEINECCVIFDKPRLICYYEAKNEINVLEIKNQLKKYFQEVLIPQKYIKVNNLRKTYNGKIDRKYYENYSENRY